MKPRGQAIQGTNQRAQAAVILGAQAEEEVKMRSILKALAQNKNHVV